MVFFIGYDAAQHQLRLKAKLGLNQQHIDFDSNALTHRPTLPLCELFWWVLPEIHTLF